jgi:S1-C subfamily serine protease
LKKILLLIFISFQAYAVDTASLVFSANANRVVLINTKLSGAGTGFYIAPNFILTNRHVVFSFNSKTQSWDSPQKINLKNGNKLTKYKYILCSKRVDLCIIAVDENTSIKTVSNVANRFFRPGEPVNIIGHPQGLGAAILSTGVVSSEISKVKGLDYNGKPIHYLGFITNAAVSQGSSGSPVFSKTGEVLGIAVATTIGAQNLNYIISSYEINLFIKQVSNKDEKEIFSVSKDFDEYMDAVTQDKLREFSLLAKSGPETTLLNPLKPETPKLDVTPSPPLTPAPAIVVTNETTVSTLNSKTIKNVLAERISEIKNCYRSENQSVLFNNKNRAELLIKFQVLPNGKVEEADIQAPEFRSENAINCIKKIVISTTFPLPEEKATRKVHQPLTLYKLNK